MFFYIIVQMHKNAFTFIVGNHSEFKGQIYVIFIEKHDR